MPIRFVCPYGHPLVVPDERAGKKGRCPVCHQRVYVPVANPQPASRSKPLGKGEVEIHADAASPPARPPRGDSLDDILAVELGLEIEPPERPTEILPPSSIPKPVAPPPAASAASNDTLSPPGTERPAAKELPERNLSSPARPIPEQVPPSSAVQPSAAPAPHAQPHYVAPSLSQPVAYVASPLSAPPAVPFPAYAPSPTPFPGAAYAPHASPPMQPELPANAPAVRRFRADEPLPWFVEPDDHETGNLLSACEGWPTTTILLALAMLAISIVGLIPAVKFWSDGVMPQWVLAILGLSVVELGTLLWMVASPDWRSLNLAGTAAGIVAACYAAGLALVMTNQSAVALPLDLVDVRNVAGGWSAGNGLAWALVSYLLVHQSRLWRRSLRRLLRVV